MTTINKICVLGAGIMGAGIAQVCAQAGFTVVIRDIAQEFVDSGIKGIENLERQVSKGKITGQDAGEILGRISGTTDLDVAAGDTDLVIEAIVEQMSLKQEVFSQLDKLCKPGAILSSNTSGLSITEIAGSTARPGNFIGIHFFNPVPVMALVELIRGVATSDETMEACKAFVQQINKQPIEVKESPGFAVNRILCPMINEAVSALAEGVASARDIDKAMTLGANHPIGPLALGDMIGLDTLLFIMEGLYQEFGDPKYRPAPLLRKMVRAGHLGRKAGQGFHSYS